MPHPCDVGRNRSFVERDVVAAARRAFLATGYEGTSVDDLVTATGLHRGSLYGAFGSKRGLFVAALRQALDDDPDAAAASASALSLDDAGLDLLLVALLELAPRDAEVRAIVAGCLSRLDGGGSAAQVLGSRLLARAHLTQTTEEATP